MGRADGLYSRIVAWLKILLPLAALALLSTLFLLSRSREPLVDVPFADAVAGAESASEQVSAPYYAGTTDRGDVLTMTARTARPEGPDLIHADDLKATLSMKDGSKVTLDATAATLRNAERQADLENGVRIESSSGYVLTTDALVSDLDRTVAETRGPVSGRGPAGTIEAGKLRIEPVDDGDDVQLLFTGGVKLVYEPQQE